MSGLSLTDHMHGLTVVCVNKPTLFASNQHFLLRWSNKMRCSSKMVKKKKLRTTFIFLVFITRMYCQLWKYIQEHFGKQLMIPYRALLLSSLIRGGRCQCKWHCYSEVILTNKRLLKIYVKTSVNPGFPLRSKRPSWTTEANSPWQCPESVL